MPSDVHRIPVTPVNSLQTGPATRPELTLAPWAAEHSGNPHREKPKKEKKMKLFTQEITNQLTANGRKQAEVKGTEDEIDFKPVVKLFTPDAGAIWLLTEIEPDYPDIAFGLCDLGLGFPELGSVSISELKTVKGALGLPVERDLHFSPKKTLLRYAAEASEAGRIVA